MRAKLLTLTVSTLATIAACLAAHGQTTCTGGYCRYPAGRVTWYYPAPAPVTRVAVQPAPQPAPVVYRAVSTTYAVPAPSWDVGTALAVINEARSLRGLGPLAWDANLASWATRNIGYHGVLAPGASQCQAWCGDPVTAARMWLASGPHLALILQATTSIGIGASEGGFTANLR